MLTRSRYQQAYKKLGDLHRRWHEAKRLLAPAVDSLPQLLILPVTLFVIGLLDNMLSSAIPLSSPFNAVFVAGVCCFRWCLRCLDGCPWMSISGAFTIPDYHLATNRGLWPSLTLVHD